MGEKPVARLNDTIDHGGHITSGSPNALTNGLPTARVGDSAVCDIHGSVTIIEGSCITRTNGLPTARVGDKLSCGAKISSGSPNAYIEDATKCGS